MVSMAAGMTRQPLALIVDDDNASRITTAAALRKVGFEIEHASGWGYSSLSSLTSFQVDTIKIDRSSWADLIMKKTESLLKLS